jgi:hypothetical protein
MPSDVAAGHQRTGVRLVSPEGKCCTPVPGAFLVASREAAESKGSVLSRIWVVLPLRIELRTSPLPRECIRRMERPNLPGFDFERPFDFLDSHH